jgi:hypothetical protein
MNKERLKLTFAFVLFLITAAVVVFFSYETIANIKTQIKYMTPAQVEVHVQDYERIQSIQAEIDASVVNDNTSTRDQRSFEEEQNNKLAELQTKKNVYTVIFIIVCVYVAFGIGLYIYGMIKDKPYSSMLWIMTLINVALIILTIFNPDIRAYR